MDGFTRGFQLEYDGLMERQDTSINLPFHVGDKMELWNKIMKEVGAGRYAGPFESIPSKNYVTNWTHSQSRRTNKTDFFTYRMTFKLINW